MRRRVSVDWNGFHSKDKPSWFLSHPILDMI
jgi:hypothetical protein